VISWDEIQSLVEDGQTLLYDGLSGKYSMDGIEICMSEPVWPDNLIFEPCKIKDREIFGVLKITFGKQEKE
jgi:hypothetical protein